MVLQRDPRMHSVQLDNDIAILTYRCLPALDPGNGSAAAGTPQVLGVAEDECSYALFTESMTAWSEYCTLLFLTHADSTDFLQEDSLHPLCSQCKQFDPSWNDARFENSE